MSTLQFNQTLCYYEASTFLSNVIAIWQRQTSTLLSKFNVNVTVKLLRYLSTSMSNDLMAKWRRYNIKSVVISNCFDVTSTSTSYKYTINCRAVDNSSWYMKGTIVSTSLLVFIHRARVILNGYFSVRRHLEGRIVYLVWFLKMVSGGGRGGEEYLRKIYTIKCFEITLVHLQFMCRVEIHI